MRGGAPRRLLDSDCGGPRGPGSVSGPANRCAPALTQHELCLCRAVTPRAPVGSRLLLSLLSAVAAGVPSCHDVCLHVQTNNDPAIQFYKSFGFVVVDTIRGCYRRASPPDAFLMRRAAPSPLRGRVPSDLLRLSQLHTVYDWLPSECDIRPTEAILAVKHARISEVLARWASFADYVRVVVFGLADSGAGADGKHRSVGGDGDVAGLIRFVPNEFPYHVPRHWVMWYGCRVDAAPGEGTVTADISAAVDTTPELAGKQFAWYVNPKMTVPEYFHVQVFLEG